MRVETYKQFGGQVPELAALRHVLTHHRVLCRQNSLPPTEAMLYGIAGGVSASYDVVERDDLSLEVRVGLGPRGRSRAGELLQSLCVRMGLPASFRHTSDPALARRAVLRSLEQGDPVIVFLSAAALPYLGEPPTRSLWPPHVAVVHALSEEEAELADISPASIRIPSERLAAARARDPALQQISVVVAAPASPVDLPKAIESGLRACWDRMLDPPHPKSSFGLPGLRRLAAALAATGEPDGWPRLFPPGAPLLGALRSLYAAVALGGSGGGAGRGMFATFLREASVVLQGPDFSEVALRYDGLSARWAALGAAALPESVSGLGELRSLLEAQEALVRSSDDHAPDDLAAGAVRLRTLEKQLSADFPLDGVARAALLGDLQARLTSLVAEEEAAIRAIRTAAR